MLRFDKLRKASLDQIDEELVSDYIEWRRKKTRQYAIRGKHGAVELADTFEPISVASINRDLAALRRALNKAREWKLIPSVPIIKLLSGECGHERVVTHAEETEYLAASPLLLREFATLMLDTGMRPEEVCRMSWDNVHLDPVHDARFGYVHNPKGKTKYAKRNLSLTLRVHALLSMRWEAARRPAVGWVFPSNDDPRKHVPYSTIDSQHGRTMAKLKKPASGEPPIIPFRLYDLRQHAESRIMPNLFQTHRLEGHGLCSDSA